MRQTRDPENLSYRWVILAASFVVRFVLFGSLYSVGVLYVVWLDEFQTSKGNTAWIGSLATGSSLLAGPLGSALISRIGTRKTVVVGGVVMSAGMLLSIFATNIYVLFFTYGILAGSGGGIANLAAVVRLTDYFKRQRALAMGIGSSGVGLGAFAFTVFQQYLLDLYGWRGSILIIGGICLNICVAGLLMIHPKHHPGFVSTPVQIKSIDINSNERPNNSADDDHIMTSQRQKKSNNTSDDETSIPLCSMQNKLNNSNSDEIYMMSQSMQKQLNNTSDSQTFFTSQSMQENNEPAGQIPKEENLLQKIEKNQDNLGHNTVNGLLPRSHSNVENIVLNLSSQNQNLTKALENDSTQNSDPKPLKTIQRRKSSFFQKIMFKMRFKDQTLSLWRDPVFVLLFVSDVMAWLVQFVPFVHLPERARLLGITPFKSAVLVSSMGFAGAVGKLSFGAICTFLKLNPLKTFTIAQILFGTSTLLSPLCRNFPSLMVFAVSFGFLSGAYCLMMVIPADLLGHEKFSAAYGFLLAGEGLGVYLGPPAVGWITDSSNSYDTSFYCSGAVLLTSGLILLLTPCAQKLRTKKL
uniref:monocarboxylate transporter 14-like n=1 Tax=Styela clava TaxID=7725 RepID=UPI00193A664B|nr:monocarboxylate transporter 14-like [Styela clava]